MGLMKELNELNALYQSQVYADVDEAMVVTNADKKANTKAYQNYKAGMKNKKGEPVYKAADHMKEDLAASGVFSEQEQPFSVLNLLRIDYTFSSLFKVVVNHL